MRVSDAVVSFHRFDARLPGSASKEEFQKARRESWRQWRSQYFTQDTPT